MKPKNKLYVIHDDGLLYFEALKALGENGYVDIETYHLHFFKNLVKGIIRRKPAFTLKALQSMVFFIRSFFIRGAVFLVGIAPYDPAVFLWARLLKHNKIIYHTSWPYWDGPDTPVRPLLKGLVKKWWSSFISHPNLSVVCVLETTKKELVKFFGKTPGMISVIPHSVDMSCFRPDKRGSRGPLKVLFTGRLMREKGLEDLCEVIRKSGGDFEFGIAGEGRDKSLLDSVINLPNVRYYGRVEGRREMAKVMRGYDVMLLMSYKRPGWEELFGMAIIEAFASGLAVVSTDCIGPVNIIKNRKNGIIIKQRGVGSAVKTLRALSANRPLLRKLGTEAVKSAKEYTIEKIMHKWRAAIKAARG